MPRFPLLLAAVLLSLSTVAFAAEDPLAFGNGPAKWLMSDQEAQIWRSIKTKPDAQKFIDLFWVRRDPTPGTYANEFRADFDSRVAFADKAFKERKTRGAMTDRGRVLIVLGFTTKMNTELAKYTKQSSGSAGSGSVEGDPTGGRQLAARDVWIWEYAEAQKFDMPKIEVVFLTDPVMGRTHRDPQRPDFMTALPRAIRNAIVNPDLMEVPDWARPQLVTVPSNSGRVAAREAEAAATTSTTVIPSALPTTKAKSAGRLTLLKDAFAVDAQSKTNPFAAVTSIETFKSGEELSFAAEYCAGVVTEELAGVTMQVKITGMVNGQKLNMSGPQEELIPDSIKASPGCHLIRGAVPLEGVDPGQYALTLTVVAGPDTYILNREFKVE